LVILLHLLVLDVSPRPQKGPLCDVGEIYDVFKHRRAQGKAISPTAAHAQYPYGLEGLETLAENHIRDSFEVGIRGLHGEMLRENIVT
jgi:hypothetical protein